MKKQTKHVVGYYHYPSCIIVAYNDVVEKGDYMRLARMSHNGRTITYIKKDLPPEVRGEIEAYAKTLHTPDLSINLTIEQIDNALKGMFFLNTEAVALLAEAQRREYVVILSATQAQWTDEGLKKARTELA
ncbi:hypothetical protein [Fibrella aestuarina]|nr:hypothetical protein [Fibrella aestuarina]